uniref:G-protein coupled receptors family 1 profile domain-containing protein n=1 Tax=Sus scrofa TaxID=9823 RepID=A0A8D0S3D8_PIG
MCVCVYTHIHTYIHTYIYTLICVSCFVLFQLPLSLSFSPSLLYPQHVEVPGPGTKPTSQQWPKSLQRQCWILNLLYHKTTLNYLFFFNRCPIFEPQNLTHVSEFLLMGLSDDPELQALLFGLFLSIYLVAMLGNLLIILAVTSDSHLHTPMYFFLSSLSLVDLGFITTTVPKMLVNIQTHSKSITYTGCLTQLSFFFLFGCSDNLLLAVMAYDRLVAICHPLHYLVIMKPRLCGLLVLVSFFSSFLDSQIHCLMVSQLTFCTNVEIPHFFCDAPQLLHLACSDTSTDNILIYFTGAIFGGIPVLGILYSYIQIVSSILRVPSSGERYKAFSTCGSHLSVVCLFYGTALGVYLSSAVSSSPRKEAVASVIYSVVIPMLNPFIYSLRNKDIKNALWKIINRIASPQDLSYPFGS